MSGAELLIPLAISAVSSIRQGVSASGAAKEASAIALQNAARETQIGNLQEQRQREISSAQLAKQRALLGASDRKSVV